MTLLEAKAVIVTLFTILDGKSAMPLSNTWKCRLAKAKQVLRDNSSYAIEQDGMYGTIRMTKTGMFYADWLTPKDDTVQETGTLDDTYAKMLAQLSKATPADDTVPYLDTV